MQSSIVQISAAVLSILRKDVTTRCVADRFGVAESQVHEWVDIFTVGGVLSLSELCGGVAAQERRCSRGTSTPWRCSMTQAANAAGHDLNDDLESGEPTTPKPLP